MLYSNYLFAKLYILLFCSVLSLKGLANEPLIIYCRDAFAKSWGQSLLEHFDSKVKLVSLSGPALVMRIRIEKQQSAAHIILGVDTTQVAEIQSLDIASEYCYDVSNNHLPLSWTNTCLIPIAYGILAIIGHIGCEHSDINSWSDLLNTKQKIIIPDPRTSTTGLEFLYWVSKNFSGDQKSFWSKLRKQISNYPKGLGGSFALFSKARNLMMVGYTTSIDYQSSAPLYKTIALPKPPIQVYGAIVTIRGLSHPVTQEVINFLRSSTMHSAIIEDRLYPCTLPSSDLPCKLPKLPTNLLSPPFLTKEDKIKLIKNWLDCYFKH